MAPAGGAPDFAPELAADLAAPPRGRLSAAGRERADREGPIGGYEAESARASWLALGVLAILLGLAASMGLTWALLLVLGPPGPRARGARPWPGVEHWQAPRADLERLRAREHAELSSYGWVDSRAGLVRTPIERAMEQVARER